MSKKDPMGPVRITAAARLHLGFLDLNGSLGRRFGSIGLAVDKPATELTMRRSATFQARGPDHDRALSAARQFAGLLGLDGAVDIDIASAVPGHAGLGSGTQLALAVGTGIAELSGASPSSVSLAMLGERGARSAIGMAAFETGGFIVDAGRGEAELPPPVVVRVPFPQDWRIILILDPQAIGVHGNAEAAAFAKLPPMSDAATAQICRLVLMQLVPGVIENDIAAFGSALETVQAMVGGHFAAAQGGAPWASADVGVIARKLKDFGAHGIGQSSWGPTGFAFVRSVEQANSLYATIVGEAKGRGLELMIASGRNRGARVERLSIKELDPRED